MITGWLYYNDAWYYLESNGVMVTGPTEIDGVWNSFEENGTWIPFSSN
jgi:glucan-binding YG repeat protein